MSKIIFGPNEIKTLVALTEQEQRRGLMHQSWPPPVMTFPYKHPAVRKFWMKDTPSPLDVVFCCGGRVIETIEGEPFSEAHIGPDFPCDLVVELPRGTAAKLGIGPSTEARLVYSLFDLARKMKLEKF